MLQNTNVDWKMWQKKQEKVKPKEMCVENSKKIFMRQEVRDKIVLYFILYYTHARITDLQN